MGLNESLGQCGGPGRPDDTQRCLPRCKPTCEQKIVEADGVFRQQAGQEDRFGLAQRDFGNPQRLTHRAAGVDQDDALA